MSRLTEAVLAKGRAYNSLVPGLDLKYGGQFGYMPRIGGYGADGRLAEEWVNSTSYLKQNMIPILMRYPKFFDFMPDKEYWIAGYKALIEEHCSSITGLSSGITVDTDETPLGGGGETMEEPTGSKRAKSSLNTSIVDKAGRTVQRLLNMLIRYGIQDPDVKKPLLSNINNFDVMSSLQGVYTADMYTSTILFIEPDITQQIVLNAWLCVNVFPKSDGENTGKRDITQGGEKNTLSIDWACTTMNNHPVFELGQTVLNSLSVLKQNPDYDILPPVDGIDPTLSAINYGFNRKQK